ncbi:hypothetical protein A9Q81_10240 [Gammaproteobacteria bacterium 42_54_T18]|nr:hypothetical protein A9Q81_10240 [Gammaproteobacteria bacterium 42_54_T18]
MKERLNELMIIRSSRAGDFLRVNPMFLAEVGFTEAELAQKPFIEWIDDEDKKVYQRAIEGGDRHCVVHHKTKAGASLPLDLMIEDLGEGQIVLGRPVESSAMARAQVSASDETTVKGTLHTIAEIIEEQNPGYKCSILLVAHGRFVAGAGPSLPDEYNGAIDGFAIGPTVGSCGTAIHWNVPIIVEDIQKDPLWVSLAGLAKNASVAACWSHPFVAKEGRVLGALALYSSVPEAPTAEQLSRLRAAAKMTGLAVERGRAEEELRKANEVKTRFMANMSHEIRTPLNALIGITDSLQDIQGSISQSEILLLRESGEQLLELFTGVLELTELSDRKGHDNVVELPVRCRQIVEEFETSAKAKGLQVECEISENIPRWISIDVWSFERILRLLIHNAVKFTHDGMVTVTAECEGLELQVHITDTGCGIDLDSMSKLREPFVQGDLSTTKSYAGFGLGLALSDLCLKVLGGQLAFDSNYPQGTKASFTLPITLAPPQIKVNEPIVHRDNVDANLPVLVVEDNSTNSKVIAKILERSGYNYQLTENGAEAVKAFSQKDFFCILMDCQMPVMDGYDATRHIRQMEEGSGNHIPIIAITANALAEDRDLCLQSGMDDYMKKPVRRQALVDKLIEYAGSRVLQA